MNGLNIGNSKGGYLPPPSLFSIRFALLFLLALIIGMSFTILSSSVASNGINGSTQTTSASFTVSFNISPLVKISATKYYNIQTVTVKSIATGHPIANAKVTLLEDCGCHGGYAHGNTNASGIFSHKDTYGGRGNYREWASVTYNGQTVASPVIVVSVP